MELKLYGAGCSMYFKTLKIVNQVLEKKEFSTIKFTQINNPNHFVKENVSILPLLRFGNKDIAVGKVPTMEFVEKALRIEMKQ